MSCPRSTVEKKVPRAMRAVRGETLKPVPYQPYFGCTGSFLEVLSKQRFQATRAMRAKRVVTVPLQPYFGPLGINSSIASKQQESRRPRKPRDEMFENKPLIKTTRFRRSDQSPCFFWAMASKCLGDFLFLSVLFFFFSATDSCGFTQVSDPISS